MKIRRIFRFLSIISAATSASMALPLLWSLVEGESDKMPLLFALLSLRYSLRRRRDGRR